MAWELWVRALGKDALEGLVGILVIFLWVIGIGVFIESLFVSIDHFGKSFERGFPHFPVGTIIFGAMIPATYFAEKWILRRTIVRILIGVSLFIGHYTMRVTLDSFFLVGMGVMG